MSHLTLEELARLLDEAPSAQEAAHLDACAGCRAELEEMREDVQALSVLPDVAPAPDSWPALERRLTEEGLIRRRRFVATPRLMQLAAAVVLFIAGTLAGRISADARGPMVAQLPASDAPVTTLSQPVAEPAAPVEGGAAPSGPVLAVSDEPVPDEAPPASAPRPQGRRNGSVTLASSGFSLNQPASTMEEAIAQLQQAEELYLAALTRYAELASGAEQGDPVSRLAALQSIVMTTEAALNQTPLDPVINGYHLTALAQRDATLRQVAAETGSSRLY